MKRIILTLICFFVISCLLFNFQNYQKLNFYNKKFLEDNSNFNKEIFLLKEIAINLEKFRLFFEPIYLEEIKRLVKESEILKKDNSIIDSFINHLAYLTTSSRKNDLTVFTNFRQWLKEKEKILKEELTRLIIQFQNFQNKKIRESYFVNIITIIGLGLLVVLANFFLPSKRKNVVSNNYLSLLEILKLVKEKTDQYLEKINNWENRIKEFQKPLIDTKNNEEALSNYKKIFTYYLLNLQLGLLSNDPFLVNKYFTNFKETGEKIAQLLSPNDREKLINFLKASEEEFSLFREELLNLKKIIGEIKNYEIKK
ncbi:MAG: hypothetical protein ABIK77_01140 [candidate division WOR-3 bacterium]